MNSCTVLHDRVDSAHINERCPCHSLTFVLNSLVQISVSVSVSVNTPLEIYVRTQIGAFQVALGEVSVDLLGKSNATFYFLAKMNVID